MITPTLRPLARHRFGRPFELAGGTVIRFGVQLFNVFNEDANDFWEDSAYRRGQLVAEDCLLPRRLMLRLSFDF